MNSSHRARMYVRSLKAQKLQSKNVSKGQSKGNDSLRSGWENVVGLIQDIWVLPNAPGMKLTSPVLCRLRAKFFCRTEGLLKNYSVKSGWGNFIVVRQDTGLPSTPPVLCKHSARMLCRTK